MRVAQKGNIFLTLLIFILIGVGLFGTYKLSLEALPGQMLYSLKGELENIRLATTELSKVQRALIYIDFANERLNEVEELEKNGEKPDNIIPVLEKFWENEQLALKSMKTETAKVEDPTQVYQKLRALRERQEVILNRLLDKTPDPQFYKILDINNKARDALNEYNLR